MELIPDSINGTNTVALDRTFQDRLIGLNAVQLGIDFTGEIDMLKLTLLCRQFGIPVELLPDDLDSMAFRDVLALSLLIYRLSGNPGSIGIMAIALGAADVVIDVGGFDLDHNAQARHDGLFLYNNEAEYRSFYMNISITSVEADRQPAFEADFRALFAIFQPVHLHLGNVTFTEAGL
ncbi:MAG: hypothetical protein LBH06_01295 [Rikenellaceae bacterium]|jgi:hypothetical protein|nr:hypothetical protein [Rikenellaceae bacterium]